MDDHLSRRLPVGDAMTNGQFFVEAWDFEPAVIFGSAALFFAYLWVVRFRLNRKTALFGSGVLLMLLTLIGPLDFLGDDYLFSAHMMEHLLLYLAVPPLLLLGLPPAPVRSLLSIEIAAKTERFLRRPTIAWLLAVGVMWLWHLPELYNAALNHEGIHAVEHLSLLLTGTIFFWPIFTPLPSHRLSPVSGAIYIFSAMSANMILGILLTFSPLGYYPTYMRSSDGTGIFRLIRTVWKLDPQSDLNMGGMFMWIIGGLLYFTWLLVVIVRLFGSPEEREQQKKDSEMQNDSENQPDPAGISRENEKENSAGWNLPKPAVIPPTTYWPFVLSLGATLMGLGILTSNVITVTGTVLFILAIIKLIGELSSEDQ
jgi:cytochrome c oxidase assembly factor CtaG